MELVREHATRNSALCLIQPHSHHETEFSDNENQKNSSQSSPSSTNSDGHQGNHYLTPYPPEDAHNSLIHFNSHHAHGYGNFANASGPLFTFERSNSSFPCNQEDYAIWDDNSHSNFASPTNSVIPFGWLSSTETSPSVDIKNVSQEEPCSMNKRPFAGESTQASKKQCNGAKTAKTKSTASALASGSPSKDPQSVAAKNRRERISERLKILQDLVPNGTKVDLVTMLEKAISYVKFLQLQVKVLATDEFWPAQGAKAPDVSQVKEAIDAILASSQRERNSSSSKS